jgi:hypothetical protein
MKGYIFLLLLVGAAMLAACAMFVMTITYIIL